MKMKEMTMPYSMHFQATIVDDETSDHVVELSRCYEIDSLSKIGEVAAHFGKSASVLVEGVRLGQDDPL